MSEYDGSYPHTDAEVEQFNLQWDKAKRDVKAEETSRLRDMFAVAVLPAIVARGAARSDVQAAIAYDIADAMLVARVGR